MHKLPMHILLHAALASSSFSNSATVAVPLAPSVARCKPTKQSALLNFPGPMGQRCIAASAPSSCWNIGSDDGRGTTTGCVSRLILPSFGVSRTSTTTLVLVCPMQHEVGNSTCQRTTVSNTSRAHTARWLLLLGMVPLHSDTRREFGCDNETLDRCNRDLCSAPSQCQSRLLSWSLSCPWPQAEQSSLRHLWCHQRGCA